MENNFSFKGKKVIIFDLDGTIIKLSVDWIALKKLLSDRYSTLYETSNCEFKSISACLNYIVERDDEEELKRFFDIIRAHELNTIENSMVIKEAAFFIKNKESFGVDERTKIAICSLNTRACIEESLKLANIMDKVDYIIGREDVRKWKPNPEGLLKIQEHYKLGKEEMIYFGDLPKDLQTGKSAGIETYLIDEIINLVKARTNNG